MSNTDVVVVGSGAAGLTAAVSAALAGARVVVLEKAEQLGGTAALSGGAAWVPCNPLMSEAGVEDSPELARTYLREVIGARFDPVMLDAFLENGRAMVSQLQAETTAVRFLSYGGSDYHPDLPGATPRARSLMAKPYDGRLLGPWLKRMRGPMAELTVFGGMQVDPGEALALQYSWRRWSAFKVALQLIARYVADRFRYGRGTRLIRGQALTARLLRSAVDLGVEFRTETSVTGLIQTADTVTGVRAASPAGESEITARGGVILATGGFSANPAMTAQYFPYPDKHIRMMPVTNVGDGVRMAEAAGAQFGLDNADNGIWMPASSHRFANGAEARYPHFAFDRCKPGALIVDNTGRRFVNEAASYHVVVRTMHARGAVPAWLIGDKPFLRKYGMGIARPFPYPFRHFVRQGYLVEAPTLAELARKLGIDAAGLEDTAARMNRYAGTGRDEDFAKGDDIFTRMLGDAEHGPNPCLGPIRTGPFYALALYPSDCGTTLGLRATPQAEVCAPSGAAIPGLYACGLDMNSAIRGNYPGAGTMIGPAMTFGWVAGREAARRAAARNVDIEVGRSKP